MILTFIYLFFAEGVVYLEPKKIINEIPLAGPNSIDHAQGGPSVCLYPIV